MQSVDLEEVEILGKLKYSSENCAILLDIPIEEFEENEEIQKHYNKGVAMGKYEIDIAIFKLAASGDLNAIKEFKKNTR